MVLYRRNRVAGGSYFFTLTLEDRRRRLLVEHIEALRASWHAVLERFPHEVIAVVVLPDHLHAVVRLPPEATDYAALWRELKKSFTRRLLLAGIELPSRSEGGYRLWQRRYWEHTLRDDADLAAHVDYVHYNPVKHGWVERVRDWPHSSFHRYVAAGLLPIDWGDEGPTAMASGTTVGE